MWGHRWKSLRQLFPFHGYFDIRFIFRHSEFPMSGRVGSEIFESGMVENVWVADGNRFANSFRSGVISTSDLVAAMSAVPLRKRRLVANS
jgi:hypothetical protein